MLPLHPSFFHLLFVSPTSPYIQHLHVHSTEAMCKLQRAQDLVEGEDP